MWLGVSDIKKQIKKELTPFFKKEGYGYKTKIQGGSIGFVEKEKEDYYFIFFNVFTSGKVWVSPICGYINQIEKLLFQIKLPDKSVPHYYDKKFDPLGHISIVSNNDPSKEIKSDHLFSEQDVSTLCAQIIEFYEKDGKPFIERTNSKEKIYKELVKTFEEKELKPLLSNTSKFFKATIVFSLFESNWNEQRVPFFKNEILSKYKNPEKWLKAYDELCVHLSNIPKHKPV